MNRYYHTESHGIYGNKLSDHPCEDLSTEHTEYTEYKSVFIRVLSGKGKRTRCCSKSKTSLETDYL